MLRDNAEPPVHVYHLFPIYNNCKEIFYVYFFLLHYRKEEEKISAKKGFLLEEEVGGGGDHTQEECQNGIRHLISNIGCLEENGTIVLRENYFQPRIV